MDISNIWGHAIVTWSSIFFLLRDRLVVTGLGHADYQAWFEQILKAFGVDHSDILGMSSMNNQIRLEFLQACRNCFLLSFHNTFFFK
jgi:hypothetical protein